MVGRGLAVCVLLAAALAGGSGAGAGSALGAILDLDAREVAASAAAIAQETFDAAGEALVASGATFADALASGALQGASRPLLLTDPGALPAVTRSELGRLGVARVTILGGEAAVTAAVADELAGMGIVVDRLAGASRFETAVAVAERALTERPSTTALIARAFPSADATDPTQAFADALAAGAWAAEDGYPLLFTATDALPEPTAAHLSAAGYSDAVIIGGEAAVSSTVAAQLEALGLTVQRVAGASRAETAVAIAGMRGIPDAQAAASVLLVDGQGEQAYAAGFAGASYAAATHAPVVLTSGGTLPPASAAYLDGPGRRQTGSLRLLCGPATQGACQDAAPRLGVDAAELRVVTVEDVAGSAPFSIQVDYDVAPQGSQTVSELVTSTGDFLAYATRADAGSACPPVVRFEPGGLFANRQPPRLISGDMAGPTTVSVLCPGSEGGTGVIGLTLEREPAPAEPNVPFTANAQQLSDFELRAITLQENDQVSLSYTGLNDASASVGMDLYRAGAGPSPFVSLVSDEPSATTDRVHISQPGVHFAVWWFFESTTFPIGVSASVDVTS